MRSSTPIQTAATRRFSGQSATADDHYMTRMLCDACRGMDKLTQAARLACDMHIGYGSRRSIFVRRHAGTRKDFLMPRIVNYLEVRNDQV